ncbi:DAHP synthetase class II [Penicillium atrosanguineum]|uniref:DAHP synthetase class II n=1 Tax=Penicillium atrosanguineum TaxID=1132637 RepID=UPI00238EB0A1|nr:DAHP synthetase class II [Penicillium atrosanguineum]KAJ5300965.1 DAHP synthetase class II [Penicillium atrosanguineum]
MDADLKNRRPHVCTQSGCGRTFLRKEHLRRHMLNLDLSILDGDQMCAEINTQEITQPALDPRRSSSLSLEEPEAEHRPYNEPVEDTTMAVPADTDIPSLTPDRNDIDWMLDSFLDAPEHDWAEFLTSDVGLLREGNAPRETGFQELDQLKDLPNEQHEDKWSDYQTYLHRGLGQLDMDLLNSPFFDPENLRKFYELYFQHYHPHFPILHQPTLTLATTNPLLFGALLALGSTLIEDETLFALGQRIHDGLRLIIINAGFFAPPLSLWCLQALLLLQAHGKMMSSRKNHELAQLMKQTGLTLSRRAYTASDPKLEWSQWIQEESWRRAAFFAFCMDSQHACMFGHLPVLSVSDMKMALPCKETLWESTSPEQWQDAYRPESALCEDFLPTLKKVLKNALLPTAYSEFGRFIILHGLICLQAHLQRSSRLTLGIDHAGSDYSNLPASRAMFTQVAQNTTENSPSWMNVMASALNTWSTCLLSLKPSLCLLAASPLLRMAQITLHVRVADLLTMATNSSEVEIRQAQKSFEAAKGRMSDWFFTHSAREAVRYALILVRETMFSGKPYIASEDRIAPRPWCLYIAVLTLWAYGETAKQHGFAAGEETASAEEYVILMTQMLQKDMPSPFGADQTAGLVFATQMALSNCRWELLHEACQVLERLSGQRSRDS